VRSSRKRGELVFRRFSIAIIIAVAAFVTTATVASAAEIQLAGIKLGRSALSIIQKYGDPSEVRLGARAAQQQPSANPMAGGMEMPPPGLAGGEMPPPGMANPFGGPSAGQQNQGVGSGREITWIYRFAKNKSLEFIIDPEGRVLQIAAYGIEWSGLRTAKGIVLGDAYKKLILTYGFPESHEQSGGGEMVIKYANSDRVAFTLLGNQVVGITIAFMD
jgi:hypothetical protein